MLGPDPSPKSTHPGPKSTEPTTWHQAFGPQRLAPVWAAHTSANPPAHGRAKLVPIGRQCPLPPAQAALCQHPLRPHGHVSTPVQMPCHPASAQESPPSVPSPLCLHIPPHLSLQQVGAVLQPRSPRCRSSVRGWGHCSPPSPGVEAGDAQLLAHSWMAPSCRDTEHSTALCTAQPCPQLRTSQKRSKLLPQQTPCEATNPPDAAIAQLLRIWVSAVSHGHPGSDSTQHGRLPRSSSRTARKERMGTSHAGRTAHKPSAAQDGCRLDSAPWGAGSASSGCSWRATTAPGSAVYGVALPQGVSPCPGHTGCSAQPSPCKRLHRQTDRPTLQAHRENLTEVAFPNGKITRRGKEKQKAETTRKTPLSLSQGTDVIQPPAPQDGKRCASSWPPLHPTASGTASSEIHINSNGGQSAPSPSVSPLAPHGGDRQAQMQ